MANLVGVPTSGGATLLVNGMWTSSNLTFKRFDPANLKEETGTFAEGESHHVQEAYTAAAAAAPGWAAVPPGQRGAILARAAELLEARVEEAARRLTADMGKAIRDARGEVRRSVAVLRYFANEVSQPMGETYPGSSVDTFLMTVEEPAGVVCVITPWNFPLAIPAFKLSPALAFGNTVVWKPAEAASGSAVLLTEILMEAGVPPGVLNMITGNGRALSPALTGDPRLSALTFTGSNSVGLRLRQAVADRNVKVQLELGGKNPAIVLSDADVDDAATQISRGAMLSTGQRCTATSRVYVQRDVAQRFCRRLVEEVERLTVGDPYQETTDIGPLASVEQCDTVGGYLKLAHDEGATLLTGRARYEDRDGDGSCLVTPTVLTGVSSDSRLMREEIFGPVVVVTAVDDYEDALTAANDSVFGLSAAIFTSHIGTAMDFIRRSRSGLVHINRETAGIEPHVPFGGLKASSSMSRELGKSARQFFTNSKTVYLRSPAE
ncbi:aldehyde dehydrogenase family protein [Rhodococcus opacus]|nr:aldehyde dehydrogenase family protein [Rhodococcus opacus]